MTYEIGILKLVIDEDKTTSYPCALDNYGKKFKMCHIHLLTIIDSIIAIIRSSYTTFYTTYVFNKLSKKGPYVSKYFVSVKWMLVVGKVVKMGRIVLTIHHGVLPNFE